MSINVCWVGLNGDGLDEQEGNEQNKHEQPKIHWLILTSKWEYFFHTWMSSCINMKLCDF